MTAINHGLVDWRTISL